MQTESKIFDYLNGILDKIHQKTAVFTQKSWILANIEHILYVFICLSFVTSIFAENAITAKLLSVTAILYAITLILKKETKFTINKSSVFLLMYFIMAVVSTITSTLPNQSLVGLSKTILYLLYFIAAAQYFKLHKEKITITALLVGLCVSFETVISFLQNYFDVMSAATWQDTARLNPELILTRVYGTLKPSNPNLLGGYFIAACPFLWMVTTLTFTEKKYKSAIFSAIFSLLSISAIFMTGCRGAYLALFVMLGCVILFLCNICKSYYPEAYKFINDKKRLILGTLAAGTVSIMFFVPKISHRILTIFAMRGDSSTSFRMNVYHSSLQMFQDNPIFGIGCGNKVFREVYGLYMLSGYDALSAYSIYLETAVESGIFALIFFICFLWNLLKYGTKSFIASANLKTAIILAFALTSVIGVLVHGFFDTIFYRPQVQLIFWLAVAVIFSFSNEKFCAEKE